MFTICIDAGHGPKGNPYPNHPGFYEGQQMFKLSQYQKAELEKYENVKVIFTRDDVNQDPDLLARGKKSSGADLFYSNHSNAFGIGFNSANGVTVIDSNKKPNTKFANTIGNAVAEIMGNYFRGTTYRDYQTGDSSKTPISKNMDYYGVIRNSVATSCKSAIIVEHGFHTNQDDSAFLIQDEKLKALAKTEVETIAKFYGLKLKQNPVTPDANVYVVKKGDSLSKIAAQYGLDWRALADLNDIPGPKYTIYVGQAIKLYDGENPTRKYIVKQGDTPWSIAKKELGDGNRYVEIEKLNSLDPNTNYAIYAGQELMLPIK